VEKKPSVAGEQAGKIMAILRTVNLLTYVGAALLFFSIVGCSINYVAVRWWVMIPLFSVAALSFEIGRRKFIGIEKKICLIGLIFSVGLAVARDAVISSKMAALYDAAIEAQKAFNQTVKDIADDIEANGY